MFIALGAQSGMALPVPGGDAPNVISGVAFLQAFNDGRLKHTSGRVLVVDGGDTSMDVAAVARRLGHIEHKRELEGGRLTQLVGHTRRGNGARAWVGKVDPDILPHDRILIQILGAKLDVGQHNLLTPDEIKHLRLNMVYRGFSLDLHVDKNTLVVDAEHSNQHKIKIGVAGKVYELKGGDHREFTRPA